MQIYLLERQVPAPDSRFWTKAVSAGHSEAEARSLVTAAVAQRFPEEGNIWNDGTQVSCTAIGNATEEVGFILGANDE